MSRHVDADARARLLRRKLELMNRPHDPAEREHEYHEFCKVFTESIEIAEARKLIEEGADE